MTISSLIATHREQEHHNVARILRWGLLGSIVLHGSLLASIRWQAPPVALEPEEVEMVVLSPSSELNDESLTGSRTGEVLLAGDGQASSSIDRAMEWGESLAAPLAIPVAIIQPVAVIQPVEAAIQPVEAAIQPATAASSLATTPNAPLPSATAATPQLSPEPNPILSETPSAEPSPIVTPVPSPLATASPSPLPSNTPASITRPLASALPNASSSADSRSPTRSFSGTLSSGGLNTAAARGNRHVGTVGQQPRAGNGVGISTGNNTDDSTVSSTSGDRSGNSVGTATPQTTATTSSPPPASNLQRQRPACISCPRPPSVRDGDRVVEGTVRVIYDISPDGRPINIRLRVSSGNAALDRATLETVQQWRFTPSTEGYTGARQGVNFVDQDSSFHREVQERERREAERRETTRREAERRETQQRAAEQRAAEQRATEPQNRPLPTAGQPSPHTPTTSGAPASSGQPANSTSQAPAPPAPLPSPSTAVSPEPAPDVLPPQEPRPVSEPPPPVSEPAPPEPASVREPPSTPELSSPAPSSSP